jgi:hypothetical protein
MQKNLNIQKAYNTSVLGVVCEMVKRAEVGYILWPDRLK